jgi:hypothetical protein
MAGSPLDQVLEVVRAALHGRRAVALERVQRIERALADYATALEEELAREFAREHGLTQPKPAHDRVKAAAALRDVVLALPELEDVPERHSEPPPSAAPAAPSSAAPREHVLPIVLVGGVGRPSSALSGAADRLEWIDTTRQGTVAIGNLTQRIRSGRVAALVLLEAHLGHRHSEPLISAARDVGIPFAYAGKGGRAALDRALGDVLGRLR